MTVFTYDLFFYIYICQVIRNVLVIYICQVIRNVLVNRNVMLFNFKQTFWFKAD